MSKSILVLDDDDNFIQLMQRILSCTGFGVEEARTASEGLRTAGQRELALAVVDFKLPDANGISFIQRLREMGNNTPVVFISAQACDPETFKYLRNILNVSLILQKPVDPNLFLDQIGSLLPARQVGDRMSRYQPMSMERPRAQSAVANMPSFRAERVRSEESFSDPHYEQHQQEISQQQFAENSVRDAQRELAANLPSHWQNLARELRSLQNSGGASREARDQALFISHALRGAAASLGLTAFSNAAAKIEGYVKLLDPNDPLAQNILWLEIFRSLADGEAELRAVMEAQEPPAAEKRLQAGRVLLVGSQQTLQVSPEPYTPGVDAKVIFTDNAVQAAVEGASSRFDAAIIDTTAIGVDVAISLAKELRVSGLNATLPLAFLHSRGYRLDDVDRIFAGASVAMPAPCDPRQFEACLTKLASLAPVKPPTVLAVDDDKVLTKLMERILTSQSINVSVLHEPINILDTLEKVQPDVLLLDVIMPGLSGYDICRIVRATEKWSQLPIIFLTSKADAQGRAAAFQAGANDFLSKPIIPEELVGRVNMQIKRAQQDKAQGADDELTGLLRERAFMAKVSDLLINCGRSSQEMTLGLVQVDQAPGVDYGMFSKINVFSTVGKLLHSRFPSESLRGVWPGGFCLAIVNEDGRAVERAISRWAREVEQVQFTAENGMRFSVTVRTAVGKYPADGFSLEALTHAAQSRLERR